MPDEGPAVTIVAEATRRPEHGEFRRVLGHFATGVAVITSLDGDHPVGFVCQSFTSVSLDPPLVSFCAGTRSTSWPRVRRSGRFRANILAEDQEILSRQFAVSGGPKFEGVSWRLSVGGCPVIMGALASVEASIVREVPAGDHVVVIGKVTDLECADSGIPLLFYRGGYGRFGA